MCFFGDFTLAGIGLSSLDCGHDFVSGNSCCLPENTIKLDRISHSIILISQLAMIEEGGNIYYLAKLAGILKLSVQDVGGLQTGRTTEEFKDFLLSQA